MGRLWVASLGDEVLYEEDLPGCCRRSARSFEGSFECPACGACWQAPLAVEPEECAFTERASDRDRKGAA
ncbi:MAG: hypothetical protein M3259_08675 [Actinomycetota bacterium]|nr:hypothetical protein [Actinomycetota bacterium]